MAEGILKTFNIGQKNYILTQNESDTRKWFGLKDGDQNLALCRMHNKNSPDAPVNEKIRFANGNIIHTAGRNTYIISTPKSATGRFQVYDGGYPHIYIEGKLEKGKVVSLDSFLKMGSFENSKKVLLSKDNPEITKLNIKELIKNSEKGTIKLHNLSKVLLKKMLAYLPK